MIYVGRFDEDDMRNGTDKVEMQIAMDKHSLNYTNTKLVRESGKIVGLDIWVCTADEITTIDEDLDDTFSGGSIFN